MLVTIIIAELTIITNSTAIPFISSRSSYVSSPSLSIWDCSLGPFEDWNLRARNIVPRVMRKGARGRAAILLSYEEGVKGLLVDALLILRLSPEMDLLPIVQLHVPPPSMAIHRMMKNLERFHPHPHPLPHPHPGKETVYLNGVHV